MGQYVLFELSNNLCSFSPNGTFLATAVLNELKIYKCQAYKSHRVFTCSGVIEHLEWSYDNKYILCAVYKLRRVHIFSIQNPEWKCKLTDVEGGIVKAFWGPDSRHVLTVAEHNVSINVWSLITKTVECIESPSAIANPAFSFSPDGNSFLVIQDDNGQDVISCYSTLSWKLENKMTNISKQRLGGVTCSPIGDTFLVWDSLLDRLHYQVFQIATSKLVTHFELQDCPSKICGVQDIAWAPSGQFLALGCLDNKVRILNNITWKLLTEFSHNEKILSTECKVYKEPLIAGHPIKDCKEYKQQTFDEIDGRPVTISTLSSDPKTGHIVMGIGLVAFSSCNRYVATVVNIMPAVVWVWSMEKLLLHSVSVLSDVITMVSWSPVESKLAIATECSSVSIWSPVTVSRYDVSTSAITKVKWHPTGKSLTLCANTKLALLHLDYDVR